MPIGAKKISQKVRFPLSYFCNLLFYGHMNNLQITFQQLDDARSALARARGLLTALAREQALANTKVETFKGLFEEHLANVERALESTKLENLWKNEQ